MKSLLLLLLPVCLYCHLNAQSVLRLPTAKFATGDSTRWKEPSYNDAAWPLIKTNLRWEGQGYNKYDGYAWYRFHVLIPSSLKNNAFWKDSLTVFLARIDDVDEAYFNGVKIGQTGSFPEDAAGYRGMFYAARYYRLPLNSPAIKWDHDNIIAVRVFDHGDGGGMYDSIPFVNIMQPIDGIELALEGGPGSGGAYTIRVSSRVEKSVKGILRITMEDEGAGKTVRSTQESIQLAGQQSALRRLKLPANPRLKLTAVFTEANTRSSLRASAITPYILTPAAPVSPRINGAIRVGIRPGTPFLYRIAATGQAPLHYAAEQLPAGLQLNESTGIINGSLTDSGIYTVKLIVTNRVGKAEKQLSIHAGSQLSLLPPMGWNSWNSWGLAVNADKIKTTMHALANKGLGAHGWSYINIDDGWTAPQRASDGNLLTNDKFADMKALGDSLHANGWQFGIYSSPGPLTCGGYTGSYEHERQDAASFARWGIDYLKYDWCSYSGIAGDDTALAVFQKPYQIMQQALDAQNRSIVYSLCQYGVKDVWKWGTQVGGQSWRTTHDIRDNWKSIYNIASAQADLYPYAGPGHWNDPDMLAIGMVGGWLGNPRPSLLSPDEQYTHVSLWCLLSAPLLLGCDAARIDDFTLSLITNDEVLAIDQDTAGHQARRLIQTPAYEVWVKTLGDGNTAIGIVNLRTTWQHITLPWKDIRPGGPYRVRDLWRQQWLGSFAQEFNTYIPPHGTTLIKVSK